MKNLILTLMAVMCVTAPVLATVRTVNNATVPVNPGQYTTIAAAIAAASNGDTLLVAGSSLPYDASTITVNKRLAIIGAGYNPKGANVSPSRVSQAVTFTCAAAGSTIMGFEFDGLLSYTATGGTNHNNISFIRNYFTYNGSLNFNVDSVVNNQFINNIFGNNCVVYFVSTNRVISTYFFNNVFLYCNNYSIALNTTAQQNIVVDHNLFLYGNRSSTSLSYTGAVGGIYWNNAGSISYSVVSNNIFYNCAALYLNAGITGFNIFSNNITFTATSQPTLPYSGSTGSGNYNNTNPLLTTIFSSAANPYLDFNLDNINLLSSSPCINAGSDGTNIGPTGGAYPIYNTNSTALTGEPPLPSVRSITVSGSSTISTGGTLNVTVTGKKLN